jgi:hypothetical protein
MSMTGFNILQQGSGICRRLRTKTSYGTFIGSPTFWESGESTTAVYWCLDTMGSAGPDDHIAQALQRRTGMF